MSDAEKTGQGEGYRLMNSEEDVEGHAMRGRLPKADGSEDDVEGHRRGQFPKADGSEDDVEGHRMIKS